MSRKNVIDVWSTYIDPSRSYELRVEPTSHHLIIIESITEMPLANLSSKLTEPMLIKAVSAFGFSRKVQ